jgi:uncharacterized protein YbjQ (UPF0145 family)
MDNSMITTALELPGFHISIYTELCEQVRAETFQLVRQHAQALRANAIIGVRYDATELMAGLAEVLCYGTAVIAAPTDNPSSGSNRE